jgi:hypothetical protein
MHNKSFIELVQKLVRRWLSVIVKLFTLCALKRLVALWHQIKLARRWLSIVMKLSSLCTLNVGSQRLVALWH